MSSGTTMFRLVDADLMRTLMRRTGNNGLPISGRKLAEEVGVGPSTISNLLNGLQQSVPEDIAEAICHEIGVDLPILFDRVGRVRDSVSTGATAVPA
jgi:transcriptional regulator with XRE-family HTH domain